MNSPVWTTFRSISICFSMPFPSPWNIFLAHLITYDIHAPVKQWHHDQEQYQAVDSVPVDVVIDEPVGLERKDQQDCARNEVVLIEQGGLLASADLQPPFHERPSGVPAHRPQRQAQD